MITRKIEDFDGVNAEDWELLANFEDAIKLTIRGKSIKVYCVL